MPCQPCPLSQEHLTAGSDQGLAQWHTKWYMDKQIKIHLVHIHLTVKSLAPICSSLTNNMFSEPILRQSPAARPGQINSKEYYVSFLCPNWLIHCHAVLVKQRPVVISLVFMPGVGCFWNIPWFFFTSCGITVCDSACLKLCACDAAYPWSQSPSPNSQCPVKTYQSLNEV